MYFYEISPQEVQLEKCLLSYICSGVPLSQLISCNSVQLSGVRQCIKIFVRFISHRVLLFITKRYAIIYPERRQDEYTGCPVILCTVCSTGTDIIN